MALPTADNLKTLDYCYLGAPFCSVPSKSSVSTKTMDYCYLGAPFVVNDFPSTSSAVKSINGVPYASIKAYMGIPIAGIKKAMGV